MTSCISAFLSLMGSSSILYIIFRDDKKSHKKEPYHRIMSGLSAMDWIVSFNILLQPFAAPPTTGWPLAMGNQTTCNFVGFFVMFWSGAAFYSAFLSIYFVATVRGQSKIIAKWEPYGHVLAVLFPLLISLLSMATGNINPNNVYAICTNGPYPEHCTFHAETPCERGDRWGHVLIVFCAFVCTSMSVFGIVNTWLVYWTVQRQYNCTRRLSFTAELGESQLRRQAQVARQATLYTLAFLTGGAVQLLAIVYSMGKEPQGRYFVVMMFFRALFPLQGFWNWLIYVRPRVVEWRQQGVEKLSWVQAYSRVMAGRTDTTTLVRRHHPRPHAPDQTSSSGKSEGTQHSTGEESADGMRQVQFQVETKQDLIRTTP